VEVGEIEVFLAVAENLHFGRTAEKVGLSQSRVSQLVRTFERRIGGRLFERTSRSVALTPLGARLRDGLAPTYAQLLAVLEESRREAARTGKVMRVGCAGATGGAVLDEAVEAYRAKGPGREVVLSETPLDDPYGPLRRKEVDVLVARLPVGDVPDITVGPVIGTDERLLAVPADHPLAERGSASVEDLADLGVFSLRSSPTGLTCPFVPLYTPSGRLIPRRHVFSTYAEMLELVAQRKGAHPIAASLLRFHRHPGVAFVPVLDLSPVDVALLWPAGMQHADVRAFAEAAARARATVDSSDTADG
jgi:DNA-binding transcriptional LysR family regulator